MSEQIQIPGYTMVGKIAEGGMATVWKARQDKLDRVVAVKVLFKQVDSDHQEYERFIYEARAAASLIHPNIVQVIDAGELDGFLYYVMEYVPGPTAGDVVDREGAISEVRVLEIASEVAEALDYAWRDHKVVHCDIKPDNLLLHRNGRTKIADLGLAQVLGHEGVAIEEDMTLGTPNYFPPEQALVEEGLDCRADMYALGATMYHLGTGDPPFSELSPDDVASQQVHGQVPNPKELNKRLSYGFCCLVERLMAKEPQNRYDDWAGVIADLMAVKEGRLVKTPLSPDLRSTVEHTRLPASIRNTKGKNLRSAGQAAAPSPGYSGESSRGGPSEEAAGKRLHVQRRGSPRVAVAHREGHSGPARVSQPVASPWPMVVGVGLVVVVLYLWTVTKLTGI